MDVADPEAAEPSLHGFRRSSKARRELLFDLMRALDRHASPQAPSAPSGQLSSREAGLEGVYSVVSQLVNNTYQLSLIGTSLPSRTPGKPPVEDGSSGLNVLGLAFQRDAQMKCLPGQDWYEGLTAPSNRLVLPSRNFLNIAFSLQVWIAVLAAPLIAQACQDLAVERKKERKASYEQARSFSRFQSQVDVRDMCVRQQAGL